MPPASSPQDCDRLLWRFGTAVRSRRVELRITQEEAAHRCSVDRTYFGGIERGERNPTLIILCQLASGLQTTASNLIQTTDPK